MNLPDIPLLSMLRARMTWLNQRQDILSQNVANADTPGYAARDLKPQDFDKLLRAGQAGVALAVTDPRHIAGAAGMSGAGPMAGGEQMKTGGTVSLEEEMIKVADTQAQFQAAANLYAKAMTLMRTAIGHS